ncbi:MAG TPA: tetratricopeptide repeat protein [Acidobacteriota bacterium]|nr:tetratricopeptide repeat protein [Acidobacteriota bacterium]
MRLPLSWVHAVWLVFGTVIVSAAPTSQGVRGEQDPTTELALILQRWGDLTAEERISRLRGLESVYPNDARVHNFLGAAYAEAGEYSQAETHFRRAVDLDAEYLDAYLNLGALYLEQAGSDPSTLNKAQSAYAAARLLAPRDLEALYQGAFIAYLLGDPQQTLKLLSELPSDAWSRPRAVVLEAAAACLVQDSSRQRTVADRLIAASGWEEEDLLPLLPRLREAGRDEFVMRVFDHLNHLGRLSVQSTEDLAFLHDELGDYEGARLILMNLARRHPDLYSLLLRTAWLAYRHGDFEEALSYLAHARDLRPQDVRVHLLFGLACVELNLSVEALNAFQKALDLEPDNPYANYLYGVTAIHWKEPGEGIPYLRKYCDQRPEDPGGRAALAEAYFLNKEYPKARTLFEELVKLVETQVTAHFYLGVIDRFEHRLDEAEGHLERVLRLDPEHVGALAELAWLRIREQRFEEAKSLLEKALQLEPKHYQANFHLLTLYSRTRDPRFKEQEERFEQLKQERWEEYSESLRTIEAIPPQAFPELLLPRVSGGR